MQGGGGGGEGVVLEHKDAFIRVHFNIAAVAHRLPKEVMGYVLQRKLEHGGTILTTAMLGKWPLAMSYTACNRRCSNTLAGCVCGSGAAKS